MRRFKKFVRGNPTRDNVLLLLFFCFYFIFCLVDGVIEDTNSPKSGHHRPASKTPLNGVSMIGRWWPHIECRLGSFVIFQGIWISIA